MFVKPGIDQRTNKPLIIRIPRTHARMLEEGMEVPQTAFWLRRLRDKDVVKAVALAPASAAAASPSSVAAAVSAPEKPAPVAPAAKAEAASA